MEQKKNYPVLFFIVGLLFAVGTFFDIHTGRVGVGRNVSHVVSAAEDPVAFSIAVGFNVAMVVICFWCAFRNWKK
jgi:hypothetical protein